MFYRWMPQSGLGERLHGGMAPPVPDEVPQPLQAQGEEADPPSDGNPALRPVPVRYEFSDNLPALIEQRRLAIVLTTYQAGRVVTIGSHRGELQVGFSHFPQAMGLSRTPEGLALVSRDAVWSLPANREIAAWIEPHAGHDIAFLVRNAQFTGPVMGHDLIAAGNELLLVNTLFNCVAAVGGPWSFSPRWQPPFISAVLPEDRCHLNGACLAEDGQRLAYATALGSGDTADSWREGKATGGVLIDAAADAVVLEGLSMPHSPRLHGGCLYLLDSGQGRLLALDPARLGAGAAERQPVGEVIAELPGFCRGLDCAGDLAVVGLSQIRESAVFGGLPLQARPEPLRCGIALVDLRQRRLAGWLWFSSGVEEIFATAFLPGWCHPVIVGPNTEIDQHKTIWLVPPTG